MVDVRSEPVNGPVVLVKTWREFERGLPVVSWLPATVEREGLVLYAA